MEREAASATALPSPTPSAAARTLEAMRLGVVPEIGLARYTVGRQEELALAARDLERASASAGAVRAFFGDYGSGKTHLLELIQEQALRAGFLTARAVLDPRETPPSHPKRVYRALVRTLRYPDAPEAQGLGRLLGRALESEAALTAFGVDPRRVRGRQANRNSDREARLEAGDHLYLTSALHFLQRLKDDDVAGDDPLRIQLLDWIEGHPTASNQEIDRAVRRRVGAGPKLYSLIDYRPWARIYAYLLSGLAELARLSGYRGLALLIDEAEFYALLSRENRDFARTLFRALAFAAGRDAAGGGLPFQVDEVGLGGYGVQRRLPAAYPPARGLYVVFAMTPAAEGTAVLADALPPGAARELAALNVADYVELARRVCAFYSAARPDWELPPALVAPLGTLISGLAGAGMIENPRQAMKFVVEFVDLVRYHPRQVGQVVRRLQETLAF